MGSLTLLLSAQAPLPNKVSCFASTCVSLDNSYLSVRHSQAMEGVPLSATDLSLEAQKDLGPADTLVSDI